MNRREFLKLGSLFAAAMVINTNPVLNAAAKLAEANPDLRVLIYLIRSRRTGKWHVKVTKYKDLAKTRLTLRSWDVDTFRPLQIVDHADATEVRNALWKEHVGTRIPNSHINIIKSTQNGKTGGKTTGAIWAQRYRNNDPRARMNLRTRVEGKRLWNETYPELWNQQLNKLHDGGKRWMENMMQNHPEEWQARNNHRMAAFMAWAAVNPDITTATASKAGKASMAKRKQDPIAHKKRLSDMGKNGMRKLNEFYQQNPEVKRQHVLAAAAAAAEKSTARRLANIDKLYNTLPDTFTRQYIYDLCKQLNIPAKAGTDIMNDTSLSIRSNDRTNTGGGRGSSIAIWTKI